MHYLASQKTSSSSIIQPDCTIIHEDAVSDQCAAEMYEVITDSIIKRQIFDIPATKLIVTERRSIRTDCCCGDLIAGRIPVRI